MASDGKPMADILADLGYTRRARDTRNVENVQAVGEPVPAAPAKRRARPGSSLPADPDRSGQAPESPQNEEDR